MVYQCPLELFAGKCYGVADLLHISGLLSSFVYRLAARRAPCLVPTGECDTVVSRCSCVDSIYRV